MDIVDTQVHLGPGGAAEMVAAMDALGIRSVLVDEWWMGTPGHPSYTVGDFTRAATPTAELAAWTWPGRFAFVLRVDRRDPHLRSIVAMARDNPHAKALRILPGITRAEAEQFAAGAYDGLFGAADECGLPIFAAVGGKTHLLVPYLQKFPSVKVIVDHCGMPPSKLIRSAIAQLEGLPDSEDYWKHFCDEPLSDSLERVVQLADHGNVALKWAHASAVFEAAGYPNEGVRPYLRRALDAFGAERIMWASDHTANLTGETWGETLFSLRNNPDLSAPERECLLGSTARRWLDWRDDANT